MGDLGIILLVERGLLYFNIIQYCWIGIFHGSNIPQTQPWFSIRSIHLGDHWSVSALPQLVDDWFGDVWGLYYLPYKGLPIAQNNIFWAGVSTNLFMLVCPESHILCNVEPFQFGSNKYCIEQCRQNAEATIWTHVENMNGGRYIP